MNMCQCNIYIHQSKSCGLIVNSDGVGQICYTCVIVCWAEVDPKDIPQKGVLMGKNAI
jgi:hypothetical protein